MTIKGKMLLLSAAVLMAFQLYSDRPVTADPLYVKQKCEPFNYEIIVPSGWHTDELTLSRRHIFVSHHGLAEIKVRAYTADDAGLDETMRKNSWNLRKIDPGLNKIIETEKISVKKNISGKLLVFEYRSRRSRMIQRTMIAKNKDTVYIVDCRAPLKSFYGYEKVFNIALSSFSYLSPASIELRKTDSSKKQMKETEIEESANIPGGKTYGETEGKSPHREIEEEFFDLE